MKRLTLKEKVEELLTGKMKDAVIFPLKPELVEALVEFVEREKHNSHTQGYRADEHAAARIQRKLLMGI